MVDLARQQGFRRVVVPEVDAREAALVAGIDVLPANSLAELVAHLWGDAPIAPRDVTLTEDMLADGAAAFPIDLQDIKGQEHAKFALEVAAAGGHNVLMMGPPGSGKTLLARSLASILPSATPSEALEVTKIYSISGLLPSGHAPHYPAAVPRPPLHHLARGARRRRALAAARRGDAGPPRCPLPGRAPGVRAERA